MGRCNSIDNVSGKRDCLRPSKARLLCNESKRRYTTSHIGRTCAYSVLMVCAVYKGSRGHRCLSSSGEYGFTWNESRSIKKKCDTVVL